MNSLSFSAQEYQRRYAAIRKKMATQDIAGILFCSAHGWFRTDGSLLSYVTGYASNTDFEKNFAFFGNDGPPILLGNFLAVMRGMIMGNMKGIVEPRPAPVKADTGNSADYLPVILGLLKEKKLTAGKLGIAGMRFFPADVYVAIKEQFPQLELVDVETLLAEVRVIKSAEEIAVLKASGAAADKAFQAFADAAEVGTPMSVLKKTIYKSFLESGCDHALQLVNATFWEGSKKVLPPASSDGDPKLEKGQTIMPELTSSLLGYCTQIATPISIGEPSQELVDFMKLNDQVYKVCRDTYKAGNTIAQVDDAGNAAAQEFSNGLWKAPFTCQTLDHERSFLHENIDIQNGVGYIIMPWYLWADGAEGFVHSNGYIGHAWGNAFVLTEEGIVDLHKLPAEIIIK